MYERIIEDYELYTRKYEKIKRKFFRICGIKSSKTRFEQIERDKSFPYVENRFFDFVSYFKKDQMDENKPEINLIVKYYKTQKELKD